MKPGDILTIGTGKQLAYCRVLETTPELVMQPITKQTFEREKDMLRLGELIWTHYKMAEGISNPRW